MRKSKSKSFDQKFSKSSRIVDIRYSPKRNSNSPSSTGTRRPKQKYYENNHQNLYDTFTPTQKMYQIRPPSVYFKFQSRSKLKNNNSLMNPNNQSSLLTVDLDGISRMAIDLIPTGFLKPEPYKSFGRIYLESFGWTSGSPLSGLAGTKGIVDPIKVVRKMSVSGLGAGNTYYDPDFTSNVVYSNALSSLSKHHSDDSSDDSSDDDEDLESYSRRIFASHLG